MNFIIDFLLQMLRFYSKPIGMRELTSKILDLIGNLKRRRVEMEGDVQY